MTIKILQTIEDSAHHFLHNIRTEITETKEAGLIVRKYVEGGDLTDEEEHILKTQLCDTLKMLGVMVPFVLIPGASVLMPILIKVAEKHNIELMPSAFNDRKDKPIIKSTRRLHCECMYQIENKLPRTKFCRKPCADQMKLREYEK